MSCAVKNKLNCRNTTPLILVGQGIMTQERQHSKILKLLYEIRLIKQIDIKIKLLLLFIQNLHALSSRPYSQNLPSLHALKDWWD